MNAQDKNQTPVKDRHDNPAPAAPTRPLVNPDTDHESVEKGKEQLGKVSGN
jgi:hypothetical protein